MYVISFVNLVIHQISLMKIKFIVFLKLKPVLYLIMSQGTCNPKYVYPLFGKEKEA